MLSVYNAERAAEGKPPATSLPGSWQKAIGKYDWRWRVLCYDAQTQRDRHEQIEERRQEMVDVHLRTLQALQLKVVTAMQTLEPDAASWPHVVTALKLIGSQLKDGTCEVPDAPTYEDVNLAEAADTQFARVAAAARKDWKAAKWLLEKRHSKLMAARDDGLALTIHEYYDEVDYLSAGIKEVIPKDYHNLVEDRVDAIVNGTWPRYSPDRKRFMQMARRASPRECHAISRPFTPFDPDRVGPYGDKWLDHYLNSRGE